MAMNPAPLGDILPFAPHSLIDLDGETARLMELAHEQTRFHRGAERRRTRVIHRFLTDPATLATVAAPDGPSLDDIVIDLPPPLRPSASLSEVLRCRSSCRRTDLSGVMTLAHISTILSLSVQVCRSSEAKAPLKTQYQFRPYPSAGALYPCKVWVVPHTVNGIEPKPYRYAPHIHGLIDAGKSGGSLRPFETSQNDADPVCSFIITANLKRCEEKYGARGYRFALLEAGHLAQNLTLAATALSLNSLVYGSFYDADVERWLGLDGLAEVALSMVLVGSQSSDTRS